MSFVDLSELEIDYVLGDNLVGNGSVCTATTDIDNSTVCFDLNSIEGVELDDTVSAALTGLLDSSGSDAELVNGTNLCLNSTLVDYQNGAACVDILSLLNSTLITDELLASIFGEEHQGNGIVCLSPEVDPNNGGNGLPGDLTNSALIQRYLVVLFYYQTTDNRKQSWNSKCISPGDFDGSEGCDYVLPARFKDGRIDPDTPASVKLASRWLSADTECSWAGVGCSNDTVEVEHIWLGR